MKPTTRVILGVVNNGARRGFFQNASVLLSNGEYMGIGMKECREFVEAVGESTPAALPHVRTAVDIVNRMILNEKKMEITALGEATVAIEECARLIVAQVRIPGQTSTIDAYELTRWTEEVTRPKLDKAEVMDLQGRLTLAAATIAEVTKGSEVAAGLYELAYRYSASPKNADFALRSLGDLGKEVDPENRTELEAFMGGIRCALTIGGQFHNAERIAEKLVNAGVEIPRV